MKKRALIAVFSLFCAILSGCTHYSEPDTLGIVAGISVEKIGAEYSVFCELVNLHGSDLSVTPSIGFGRGKTISDALRSCEENIGKQLYLAHLQVIIATGAITLENILSIADFINSSNEIPLSVYPIVAPKMRAENVWPKGSENKKITESIKSFALAKTLKGEIAGSENIPFYKFYRELTAKSGSPKLPLLSNGAIHGSINFQNNTIITTIP